MVLRLYEQGKRDSLANDIIRKDIETAFNGVLPLELKCGYTVGRKKPKVNSEIISELQTRL